MAQKLLNDEIDLALVENESSLRNIRYVDFLSDEIIVVAGSESLYAKRKQLSLEELLQTPVVLREAGSGTLEVIRRSLQRVNVNLEKMNIILNLGSTEAIKNFLTQFDGIALISEKAVRKEMQLREIVKIKMSQLVISRQFRIAFRKGPEMQLNKLFTDFLLSYNF
jgi:DNA-binding transcriptional LysR family regulator